MDGIFSELTEAGRRQLDLAQYNQAPSPIGQCERCRRFIYSDDSTHMYNVFDDTFLCGQCKAVPGLLGFAADSHKVDTGKFYQWKIYHNGRLIDHQCGLRSKREAEIEVKRMIYFWELNIVNGQLRRPFRGTWGFLSNFYPHNITITIGEQKVKATSESWYQAKKCADLQDAIRIAGLSPNEAKLAGRKVKLVPDWDEIKVPTMRKILQVKFSYPELLARLKATAPEELVEWNHWHDCFWGRCYCQACKSQGDNWLGRLLMEIRDRQD